MTAPFDATKLERLMEDAGVALIVANSRHNVRYLSGGYYYHFHENSTRMGTSQYQPFVGIVGGRLDRTFYIHRSDESGQMGLANLWFPSLVPAVRGTLTSAEVLAGKIKELALAGMRIGLELPFIPADSYLLLCKELPNAVFVDATPIFNELRTIKTEHELAIMRSAYTRLADSIHATFLAGRPGVTTKYLEQHLQVEMATNGLAFLFALVSAGPGFLRAPSTITWESAQILHIDAGGAEADYVADICRMACLGEPSKLARDLHAACLEVQNTVRSGIRPGASCGDVVRFGEEAVSHYEFSQYARFVVHGIGMVPYEPPIFDKGSLRLLEPGMVLSIETDFIHPKIGHVKIEDAVAVTSTGCEGLGDGGREWTIPEVG
ncbi:MAG: Xaa-Pro peptidase family protein [Spirochaetota bacterium]